MVASGLFYTLQLDFTLGLLTQDETTCARRVTVCHIGLSFGQFLLFSLNCSFDAIHRSLFQSDGMESGSASVWRPCPCPQCQCSNLFMRSSHRATQTVPMRRASFRLRAVRQRRSGSDTLAPCPRPRVYTIYSHDTVFPPPRPLFCFPSHFLFFLFCLFVSKKICFA